MSNQSTQNNKLLLFFKNFRIAVTGSEKNFTTGSINRAIFMLSIPMILEMAMESLFAVVDIFYVSRVSVDAIATIGLTESVIMLIYAVSIGLSMATTAMVARRVGEKKPKDASDAGFQAILIAIIISISTGVLGIIYAKDILRIMGASEELIVQGYGYTKVLIGGNVTIMLIFLINAIFRGAGDASIAMRTLWLSNGLNIILDPIFIFGFGPIEPMGVQGAAVATTIGRGIGVIYQIYNLTSDKSIIKLGKENIKVIWSVIFKLLKVSIGGVGQFIIATASWILLVRIISIFGSAALAGYTIAFRIIIFTILPSWGMANAAATLVGQNLGAQQPDRAEKSVWRSSLYNMVFLAFISLVFGYWAKEFVGIFSSEPEVVTYGTIALRIICFGYIFFAYGMVISQAFNGAGDTRTPTIVNFFCYWIFQLPFAYWLAVPVDWGPNGVFIAITASNSILALVLILIFRKGRWKSVRI